MKKYYKIILICILFCSLTKTSVYAESVEDEILEIYDFADIDRQIEDISGEYSFHDIIKCLLSGDLKASMQMIKTMLTESLFQEILYNKAALVKIIMLAIISSLFSNLAIVLDKTEISETGFFITYILMITILMNAFGVMSDLMLEVTEQITTFVKTAIPSLVLSVGICCGQTTALGFGELALFLIYVGEVLIRLIILPFIKLYVVIMVVNYFMKEDYLSSFGNLFREFVLWFLKVFTAFVMGINLIRSMILPGIDSAGKNTVVKLVNLIPGAEEITSAGSIFLSSASVIKNAVGGAFVVVLLMIMIVPMIKMLLFTAVYKVTAAIIQPIADKRLSGCVECTAHGVMLLNKLLVTQFIMLSLSVAILCIVTT